MSNNPTAMYVNATGTVGSVDSKLSKYKTKDGDEGFRFSFSVALFSHYFDTQDKKSVRSDNPMWVRVTLWGEDARNAIESIHKRDAVSLSGMMRRTQPYTNNNDDDVEFAFEMSQNPTVALVVDAAHTASQEWALEDDSSKSSRSSRRSKRRDDDDEEESTSRSSRRSKRRDDDDEDEEERPRKRRARRDEDEEEEEAPRSRRRSRRDDDDEEEEERPRKRRGRRDNDNDDDAEDFISQFKGKEML